MMIYNDTSTTIDSVLGAPQNQEQTNTQYSDGQNSVASTTTITGKSIQGVLGTLWFGGAIIAGLILLLANLRFAAQLRRRTPLEMEGCSLPVYEVKGLPSPCLFGLFLPAVYVTSAVAENPVMLRHVLAHEETHARHLDHIWSVLRCAALAIHWWNPLVWLAVSLSRRDSEFACDEGTIQHLGSNERKAYGWTLLTLSTAEPASIKVFNCAATMAGNKKTLWERVSRIATGSTQLVWVVILAVFIAVSATACSFTDASAPGEVSLDPDNSVSVESEQPSPVGSAPVESKNAEIKYDDAEALAAYRAVVTGETDFTHVVGPDETLNLNIANICDVYNPGQNVVSIDFTVLDLDGDGIREVILGLDRNNGGIGGFEILHYQDGTVYGFLRYIRGFNDLKADGTFWFSDSAVDHGFGKLSFTESGYTVDEITYSESGESFADMTYVVDHQPATKDGFNAAVNAFERKESATWHDLTENNIAAFIK